MDALTCDNNHRVTPSVTTAKEYGNINKNLQCRFRRVRTVHIIYCVADEDFQSLCSVLFAFLCSFLFLSDAVSPVLLLTSETTTTPQRTAVKRLRL